MLTCMTKLTVQPGQEQEFERLMRMVAPKVREEPGTRTYIVHRSRRDPRVFLCYATYDDQAALEAHRAHLHVMDVDLQTLLAEPPTIECYEQLA